MMIQLTFRGILLTAIFIVISLTHLFAQDSTRADLFPLHDGDYWEYDSHLPFAFPDTFFTATHKVIGDTLMPNGKTYKQIQLTDYNDEGILFRRLDDSLNVLEFHSSLDSTFEKLLFKLNAQIGEIWFPWFPDSVTISQIVDVYDVIAFGKVRKVMEIHEESYPSAIVFWNYTLIEGIGLVNWSGEGFFWSFRGAIIDSTQYGIVTSIKSPEDIIPRLFELYQNYPNPFNAETTIRYRLAEPGKIQITIYDITGREVKKLLDEEKPTAGEYSITWNGKDSRGHIVSSGVYFYQLKSTNGIGRSVETKKMILIK